MLPKWLIMAMVAVPCNSVVEHGSNITVAYQCPVAVLQGPPPSPPMWWRPGMLDKATPIKIDPPKYKYVTKTKVKKKYKKKRRR